MTFGKSIRLYLKDGTVTGLKFGEIVNHTIQAISCPRRRLSELNEYTESKRPGVYFLFGIDEVSGEPKVYIGEAENVYDRIQKHFSTKDFWNEVILFINKDENLTKSHVKYLESRLLDISKKIGRYALDNWNQQQLPSLPPPDRDAMEEYLIYVKMLLGILGHKLLEEINVHNNTNSPASESIKIPAQPLDGRPNSESEILHLNMSGLAAKAVLTDEGIVVLKNSEAALKFLPSLSFANRELRDKLENNCSIKSNGTKFIFEKDTLFDSPSQAGAIIVGYSINGPASWKKADGKSIKDIEQEKVRLNN